MRFHNHIKKGVRLRTALAVLGAAFLTIGAALQLGFDATTASAEPPGFHIGGLSAQDRDTTTANLAPGSITHVWLIILENKSYNVSSPASTTTPTCGRPSPPRAPCSRTTTARATPAWTTTSRWCRVRGPERRAERLQQRQHRVRQQHHDRRRRHERDRHHRRRGR